MANTAFDHASALTIPGSTTNNGLVRWGDTSGTSFGNITGITSDGSNLTLLTRGEIRFSDADSTHFIAFESPATVGTSYTMTLPADLPAADEVLTVTSYSGGAGVLEWAAAGGGTTVAGTTDNAILTFVNSGSTFAAETGLTFSSGVLRVDSESTSVSAIISIEVDASSTGDPLLRWREGSGNGDANNQQYEAWMDTENAQFRFRSQNIDGSSSEGDVWVINDGSNNVKFNGNVVMGVAGKGIDFSATANSSGTMTSELLDDYEYGTWTPAISGSSYTTQIGRYVKVGRMVHVTAEFQINSHGGSVRRITGLPFTSANTNPAISTAISVSYFADLAVDVLWIGCYVENNSAQMQFPNMTSAGSTVTSAAADIWGDGARINFAGTYEAAA